MSNFIFFMRDVVGELQDSGNLGTAHVYRSSLNAVLGFHGDDLLRFVDITPEWLKGFEVYLRARGCSWNTVSTYLRTLRAVYNRAVDRGKAEHVPRLFRSVYTGTRADRRKALDGDEMRKVLGSLPRESSVPPPLKRAQELFALMFLLRGLPFVDLAYLRKSDLRGNVITYRRRKTGRSLSVTLTPEAMLLLKKHKD
ncbi:site-specific integrase, partial [Bacteroides pyogenes]